MFEITEEKLLELESDYDVSTDYIKDYATMILNCSFLQDEETFYDMLESSISILSSLPKRITNKEESYKSVVRKEILTKVLTDVFINCPDNEIEIEVNTMLNSLNNKRRK